MIRWRIITKHLGPFNPKNVPKSKVKRELKIKTDLLYFQKGYKGIRYFYVNDGILCSSFEEYLYYVEHGTLNGFFK